ncbi:hypothetical protein GTZ99_05570 [Novosphingobium sp. FSY-8]|uniref:Copper resistance protein D n=1 Tax=Novosphingobium ovatum TaxID=1908523 RepID=A0ABW9XBV8_9SPHN|nr:hypothetical protein [Novosphingobium ovatum]NBC36023.1 hypothetical protein [Novosphingobium ovatum]
MTLAVSLLTLLHLLIPIYWLGGDLGAFYGATFLTDSSRPVGERMMSLKILNNIDMAPRTTLILAFPTGFSLAVVKGWVPLSHGWLGLVWVAALAWLALAWVVHLKHGATGYKRIDIVIRYIVLAGLLAAGIGGLAGAITLPLFIAGKMLALAACIALGLLVRVQLVPLFPAIIAMKNNGATPQTDAAIVGVLSKTRPTVMVLWVVVLAACLLGIATPV